MDSSFISLHLNYSFKLDAHKTPIPHPNNSKPRASATYLSIFLAPSYSFSLHLKISQSSNFDIHTKTLILHIIIRNTGAFSTYSYTTFGTLLWSFVSNINLSLIHCTRYFMLQINNWELFLPTLSSIFGTLLRFFTCLFFYCSFM